jgi:adenylate kinase family enzyme
MKREAYSLGSCLLLRRAGTPPPLPRLDVCTCQHRAAPAHEGRVAELDPMYSSVVLSQQGVISSDVLAVQDQTMRALERVHIFGAAGCGSTTLGRALACELECQYLDVDDVYWLPTIPPYQTKRVAAERIRLLEVATHWTTSWVLSGSIVGWGDALVPTFDLVVFLYVPAEVRLARLRAREQERFGSAVEPNGSMYEQHQAFLQSAAGYDTSTSGRTLETDATWLAQLNCPVMSMKGECSTCDQVSHILSF